MSTEFLQALEQSPLIMGMYFLPNHFRGPTPDFHIEIIDECFNTRHLAVAAPRESAKSTILAFLYPLYCILFKKKHFILIVSNTYKKASGSLDSIKKEITDNPMLAQFGIVVERDAEGDSIFRFTDGTTCRVLCKGAEQIGSVRGEKFGAYRPDLIIVDDLEDDELVKNPVRRLELQELFDQALVPAGDKETCSFVVIGTILHDDSLMAKLVSKELYPEWTKLTYRALRKKKTGELDSLWSYKWTVEDLQKMARERPGVFAKEYQNNPVSGVMQKFHKEDFRYWKIENMGYVLFGSNSEIIARGALADCRAAIACDLAWEEGKENDDTVIMPGFLTPQNEILVDTYIRKKGMRPHEIEEILFEMEARLKSITGTIVYIGFEKAKLEKVMKYLLGQAMKKRNQYLNFKELMWDGDKIQRIETRLEARYHQHVIFHKQGMGDLEAQLTRFPSAAHDDLPDAEQGLVQLLNYPKGAKRVTAEETEFDRLRRYAIEKKRSLQKKTGEVYKFGGKSNRRWVLPHTVDYR